MPSNHRKPSSSTNLTEKMESLEPYWDEDWQEQEWRQEIGSGRKPNLDEYDKWDK